MQSKDDETVVVDLADMATDVAAMKKFYGKEHFPEEPKTFELRDIPDDEDE